jgi:hypothetical protein
VYGSSPILLAYQFPVFFFFPVYLKRKLTSQSPHSCQTQSARIPKETYSSYTKSTDMFCRPHRPRQRRIWRLVSLMVKNGAGSHFSRIREEAHEAQGEENALDRGNNHIFPLYIFCVYFLAYIFLCKSDVAFFFLSSSPFCLCGNSGARRVKSSRVEERARE